MKLDPDEGSYDDTIPLTSSTSASSAWDQPCMNTSSRHSDLNFPFSALFNEQMHIFAIESKSALLATGYLYNSVFAACVSH